MTPRPAATSGARASSSASRGNRQLQVGVARAAADARRAPTVDVVMTPRRDGVRRRDHVRGAHRAPGAHGTVRPRPRARSHQARARGDGDRRRAGDGGLSSRARRPDRRTICSSACLLAATCPVLLVPAMNDHMWAHPQTQAQRRASARARLPRRSIRTTACSPRARAVARAACRNRRPSSRMSAGARARDARSRASACSSPPARRAKRSIPCDSSRTTAAARWASRSPPRRGGAARDVDLVAGPLAVAPPPGIDACMPWSRPSEMAGGGRAAASASRTCSSWRRRRRIFVRRTSRRRRSRKTDAPRVDRARADAGHSRRRRSMRVATGAVVVGFALETNDAARRTDGRSWRRRIST